MGRLDEAALAAAVPEKVEGRAAVFVSAEPESLELLLWELGELCEDTMGRASRRKTAAGDRIADIKKVLVGG